MDAADEAPSTEGAGAHSDSEFMAVVESQAFLDSWLSKDGEHADHNDERGGELLQEEKSRLEQLRRRDVKKLKVPELAEEVHLRARKRKSSATARRRPVASDEEQALLAGGRQESPGT